MLNSLPGFPFFFLPIVAAIAVSYQGLVMPLDPGPSGIAANEPRQETQLLRWKFATGDKYRVQLGQSSEIDSEVNSRKVSTTQDVNVWLEWEVDKVEDEMARMTWKFTRVHSRSASVKMRTAGSDGASPIPEIIEFDTDSAKPEDTAAAKLFQSVKPIINQPFKITMTDRGEITGVAIPSETMEILRKFPGSMRIRQLMTEEGIKDVFGRTSIVLPKQEIEPEHSWSEERVFEIPLGKIKQVTTFVFKGESSDDNQNGLLIEAASNASIDSFVNDGRPKLEIDSQESRGELWFDPDQGVMNSATVKSVMQTTTPYRDMEVKATMTSELDFKLEKAD